MKALSNLQAIAIAFGSPLVAAAFVGSGVSYSKLSEARAHLDWSPTVGTMLERHVDQRSECTRVDQKPNSNFSCNWRYSPEATYSYRVDGVEHRSTRISWTTDRPYETEEEAQAYSAAHHGGREITVYYDPSDPDRAVLVRSLPADVARYQAWFLGMLGSALLLLTVGLTIVFRPILAGRRRAAAPKQG